MTAAPRTGKLSPLEAEAIAAIYAHRVVSTAHLHAWLTPTATSSSYLRRALSFLRDQGLIGNLGRRGKRELLWYVTTAGAAVAEDSRRVVPRIWRLDPARITTLDPSHTLAVNDLGTAILTSARRAGHEMTYLDWTQEIVHPTGPGGYAAFGSPHLVTDAVFRITTVDAGGAAERPGHPGGDGPCHDDGCTCGREAGRLRPLSADQPSALTIGLRPPLS
ncbi:replication-relaxation family protein [Catenulispora rubra]|uniref:replication-relaxation family protein n=1 Tax=Catenulispora rubra TaxID=280293 RepID=UPI0018926482|nr:replication-relaxation family protein [Catenulispora rubra]